MKIFDVYSQYEVEPIKGQGAYVYDKDGKKYLDFYGGHAVISIGHSHPHFIKRVSNQLQNLAFYSNAVKNNLQNEYAEKLSLSAGLDGYELFLCNSGAEANENAIKLASFKNGRSKVLALKNGFHGRTSAAVRVTDNPSIQAEINKGFEVEYLNINDISAFKQGLEKGDVCAVIVEAIQGIGGCHSCSIDFLEELEALCQQNGTILILDEVQCGFGRSGKFFAFQYSQINPDVISLAKGMGNGFPVGGILINKKTFESKKGMLGSTFGGNHLACSASLAVVEVFEKENLLHNALNMGAYFRDQISKTFSDSVKILGKGLMIGLEFEFNTVELRKEMLYKNSIFTGSSAEPRIMRILPPLNINKNHIDHFIEKLNESYKKLNKKL